MAWTTNGPNSNGQPGFNNNYRSQSSYNGGFAAYSGDVAVVLNNGAELKWDNTRNGGVDFFTDSTTTLVLGSRTANAKITFTNNLNLGAGAWSNPSATYYTDPVTLLQVPCNGHTFDAPTRTINVVKNVNSETGVS